MPGKRKHDSSNLFGRGEGNRRDMGKRIVITGGSGFIGRNLIEALSSKDLEIYNLDVRVPEQQLGSSHSIQCDIMNQQQLTSTLRDLNPETMIHLAARTDTDGVRLTDYAINIDGTRNLVEAAKRCSQLERFIFTSSQFVVGPGPLPKHDEDFRPHTIYGQSKAVAEQIIRKGGLVCAWTIVRPTNVWGPWHPRYPHEFWRVVKRGRYLHPGRKPVLRSYAYVGNLVFQMQKILQADIPSINGRVFYLGDPPIDLYRWTSAFSRALVGREPRVVRRGIVMALAVLGDGINRLGPRFPLTLSRYRSMTVDYITPMAKTIELFGDAPYSLEDGVNETVCWLRSQDEFWF
jgi:nucleoside-diphosphate-sugar epimerase